MKKLFYTDPLAAAYMAREFGVEILIENIRYQPDNGEDPNILTSDYQKIIDAFTFNSGDVSPDSYHIFEPQVGDLILDTDEDNETFVQWVLEKGDDEYIVDDRLYNGKVRSGAYNNGYDSKVFFDQFDKIIQRNNKPFFHPLSEEKKK